MRQLKSVFYNVWERRLREQADEEKTLLARVEAAVEETVTLMNEAIPRPCLGGVTPADVHKGKKDVRRQQIGAYQEREASRQDVPRGRGPTGTCSNRASGQNRCPTESCAPSWTFSADSPYGGLHGETRSVWRTLPFFSLRHP